MFEVEVKFRVDSLSDVRRNLLSIGAKKLCTIEEKDLYFNHPCKDFAKSDEALRIRVHSDGTIILTYKGPRMGSEGKSREEINVKISSDEDMERMLERLGFRKFLEIVKEREVYTYENFTINLDQVRDLGSFVEIETLTTDSSLISNIVNAIADFAKKIGLDPSNIERKTYLELALEKLKFSGNIY